MKDCPSNWPRQKRVELSVIVDEFRYRRMNQESLSRVLEGFFDAEDTEEYTRLIMATDV